MSERVLTGLTIVFFGAFILNLLVHWLIVCRALYKSGARRLTGLLPWRFPRELDRYRELLRAHSDSLSLYYIILVVQWFTLILGVIVGLVWLSRMDNPRP